MRKSSKLTGRNRIASGALVLAATVVVAACKAERPVVTSSIPLEYNERHPIRLVESEHSVQLLVGSGRGDLTADQRAQVGSMASLWRRQSTGRLFIDVPKGSRNERAAAYSAREARSLLQAAGVPPSAIVTKTYAATADNFGPVRIAFARIEAQAGPCGAWPEDLGASIIPNHGTMPAYWDNRPYWNFGCASQQNLAAQIVNPEDLVQPRAVTEAYAPRRQTVIERYRKGENPSGRYDTDEAKITQVGQ
jgi:pilus assembly protein CpaD